MMVTKENVIVNEIYADTFRSEMLRYLHLLSNGLVNIEYIWQDDNNW